MLRRQHNPPPLVGGNARRRPAKIAALALADFNKHQHAAIKANQINLATAHAKIAVNDA